MLTFFKNCNKDIKMIYYLDIQNKKKRVLAGSPPPIYSIELDNNGSSKSFINL